MSTAQRIMETQDTERLFLPVRPEIDAYVQEAVQHAMRPLDTFPPYQEPKRSAEVIKIEQQISELQAKRQQLIGEIPGEVVIHGIRTRRMANGGVPVTFITPGYIPPIQNPDNIPIHVRSLWDPKPSGDDQHKVVLKIDYGAGFAGDQKTRMALDFIRRDDGEADYEDDWAEDTEDVVHD